MRFNAFFRYRIYEIIKSKVMMQLIVDFTSSLATSLASDVLFVKSNKAYVLAR